MKNSFLHKILTDYFPAKLPPSNWTHFNKLIGWLKKKIEAHSEKHAVIGHVIRAIEIHAIEIQPNERAAEVYWCGEKKIENC